MHSIQGIQIPAGGSRLNGGGGGGNMHAFSPCSAIDTCMHRHKASIYTLSKIPLTGITIQVLSHCIILCGECNQQFG